MIGDIPAGTAIAYGIGKLVIVVCAPLATMLLVFTWNVCPKQLP